ncbi:TDBD domain-containing protein [Heracleum sosnowskyi]|uniref:TDBD domain-containing protein n=1 Tax=Heracleum sosnowskyi TaxID=360622 RepID=A0AAD8IRB0_9APIA|nr:TDBD domain-containing protein [Heracleum sosnowskyi]
MTCNKSSRIEQKRSQQWFLDSSDTDLFPNKKQTVEVPNHTLFSGLLTSNTSHCENASSFQPVTGHFNERLFNSETERSINFDHGDDSSVGIGTMNFELKVLEDSFKSDSSFDLRSCLGYSGIRKVKVSQVNDSEDYMSAALEQGCASGDNDIMPLSHAYSKAGDASITMGLSFKKKDENVISMTNIYNREDDSLISMDQSYNEDDCRISVGQSYKINNNSVRSYCLNKDATNVMAMMDKHAILMSNPFKDSDDVIPVGQPFSMDDNNVSSIGQIFNKEITDTPCIGQTDNSTDEDSLSLGHTCNTISNRQLPMDLSFSNGESTIIAFGGLNDFEDRSPSEILECNHDLLFGQSLVQNSEALNQKRSIDSNISLFASDAQMISHSDSSPNKKVEQKANKKAPLNNFPSNVRSLLSTGIFDGVPVKYVSWSSEKELRAIIKGSGYLCDCQSCNLSKVMNAYEYERHAGCKTKHPNNHIYFDNGKTVYGIVQELRSTPQNLLFEVIQTITGSPINQKAFRLWKESFLAATRELQRIYGKEDGKQLHDFICGGTSNVVVVATVCRYLW